MANEKPMGMYIHIPFCSRKCDYCDFVSYSMDEQAQRDYLEALFIEIDNLKKEYEDRVFDTLFIGGGTPSIVYEGFIKALTRKLFSSFHFAEKIECTIEVNPESFTQEKFIEYLSAGINRISVGLQCLDTKLLASHGRIEAVENINGTFKLMMDGRFMNVNSDVMIGLPGQSTQSVYDTVKFLIDHDVKHISVYSLQIEKHTVLHEKLRRGKIKPFPEKKIVEIYKTIYDLLQENGYVRYEVSNYAKPGFESKHNKKYWENVEYLGLGVSAHSYVDGYRYYNTKRLDTYIENLKENKNPIYTKEYVSKEQRRTERIMLSLRTTKGLNLEEFKKEFDEDLLKSKAFNIERLQYNKMVEIVDGYLRITPEYFYVSNSIIIELI